MTLNSEVRACLIDSMSTVLDRPLEERGFTRPRSGLLYERVRDGATQTIDVSYDLHPKDNPSAAASVYPFMEVFVPPVDALLKDMIEGDLGLLAGVTRGTSWQPIEITSAKQAAGRWFLMQPDSAAAIMESIREFLDRWTLPLLDTYTSAESIVAAEQVNDARILRDRAQTIRVVAAALICGRKAYAQALLDKWLGAPVPRRRYRRIFEYVERAT
jgi:hypothetical protein